MQANLVSKYSEISRKRIKLCKMSSYHLIIIFLLTLNHHAEASGVFELELIDILPKPSEPAIPNETQHQRLLQPTKVLVCLKEAFTSQLDGPCTFGNASITIDQPSAEHRRHEQSQQQDSTVGQYRLPNQNFTQTSQGSPLTNVVRILFTFRWTKSFTIILTAEQISANDQPQQRQHQSSMNRPQIIIAGGQRRLGQINGDKTAEINDNLNKSTTIPSAIVDRPQNSFIDRHVLTENEVLPNLESNPSKPWTSRFSRSVKSSLFYRFRVFCALNYYGDGCTTFCRPRDDQFGHYNCSSTGQKICHDGWNGPDCDKAKCRPGCNQQHGFCEKPDTCQCRPGWTGSRCDECITYPGCQNGYCLSPWQCVCQRNWGGFLCDQDLNVCGTHDPCKNNGTCQNAAPGRYRCHCSEGFTGVNCETSLNVLAVETIGTTLSAGCAMNPCLNGGICYGFNSQLVDSDSRIVASTGTISGENFDGLLESLEHQHHATDQQQQIVDGSRHYRCQCSPGWTGDFCQWSDSLAIQTDQIIDANPQLFNRTTNTNLFVVNATETGVSGDNNDGVSLPNHKNESNESNGNNPEFITSYLEPPTQQQTTVHLNMRHLISGVVIASVVGVFLASLLLAWCCLIAVERNRFSFIQMNIVRNQNNNSDSEVQMAIGSTLRSMQEKLRNSLRCSSRIKPETKLSIENVLNVPMPPPSYEESNGNSNCIKSSINGVGASKNLSAKERQGTSTSSDTMSINSSLESSFDHYIQDNPVYATVNKKDNLVKRGALEQEMANKKLQSLIKSGKNTIENNDDHLTCINHNRKPQIDQQLTSQPIATTSACPVHGQFYRRVQVEDATPEATMIEIEYQPKRIKQQPELTAIGGETSDQIRAHEHYHYPPGWV